MSATDIEETEETGTDLAELGDMAGIGLEDFDSSDMVMPRLNIDHKTAEFEDNLTGEKFGDIEVVLLGVIKQRILWAEEVDDGEGPLCKSYNFKEGHPGEDFPWKASGFEKKDGDDVTLPCEECALKEWDSHPSRKTPWCSEQYTFPLLMQLGEGEFAAPAIVTFQRSGVKPVRSYTTGFARAKKPLFTAVTKLSLKANKKGSVDYAVPAFQKVGDTDSGTWKEYAEHYRSIRGYLTTPPAPKDDDEPGDTDNASDAAKSDDDLPF